MRENRLLGVALMLTGGGIAGCARPVDTAAEERTIREIDRKWVEVVAAKDSIAVGNIYAEDGEFLAPNAPRAIGRAAVRSSWTGLFKIAGLALTFEPTRVVVSSAGDVAFETGTYKLGFDGPKGRLEDQGKFVVAWTKVNGEWKAAYDIFNSDKPAAMVR